MQATHAYTVWGTNEDSAVGQKMNRVFTREEAIHLEEKKERDNLIRALEILGGTVLIFNYVPQAIQGWIWLIQRFLGR